MSELKALDERELMYELVIDICNDLDVTSLCHKILQNVCLLVDADRCSLFLVQGEGENRYCQSACLSLGHLSYISYHSIAKITFGTNRRAVG